METFVDFDIVIAKIALHDLDLLSEGNKFKLKT